MKQVRARHHDGKGVLGILGEAGQLDRTLGVREGSGSVVTAQPDLGAS